MASLQDMIRYKIVRVGDTIEFTFKGNNFQSKIMRGGLIGDCEHKLVHEPELKPILRSSVGFTSLTAWTESCLQDVLEEYYTRYSSWKRVFHKETKRSMSDLRDQCKLQDKKRKQEDVAELYKEIFRLQRTIDEMNTHIKKIHKGADCRQWTYLNIQPKIQEEMVEKKRKKMIDMDMLHRAEDAMCNRASKLTSIVHTIINTHCV